MSAKGRRLLRPAPGAILLAGGASRRMGRDKATLEVVSSHGGTGAPAAAYVARVALEVASHVVVVGAPGRALPRLPAGAVATVDPPEIAGRGPLAGVLAGLRATDAERVFVLTVDALALSPELLRALDALDEGAGVAPLSHRGRADRLQPFPSLVPRLAALAIAERLLGCFPEGATDGSRGPRATAWIDELAPRAATRELLLSTAALRDRDPDLLGLEDADDPAAAARLLLRLPVPQLATPAVAADPRTEERTMGLVLAPIPADKLDAWKAFMAELTGPRKADFEEFNRRHGLTKHEAWLCESPMGASVVVIHEGPGAAEVMPKVGQSTHEFDRYFLSKIQAIHGVDPSKGPPGPMPVRMISWTG